MALKAKYQVRSEQTLRDARPWTVKFIDNAKEPSTALMTYTISVVAIFVHPFTQALADLILLLDLLYFWWLLTRETKLPYNLPKSAKIKDPNNKKPDGSKGMADGILFLGNDSDSGEEIWFTNSNARTHCLYLGTTGAGKTVGLRAYACNAFTWASGFIYIDGKADTSLWSMLSAQARRFGRDDDLLIMNYMTGNAAGAVASNTLNPFSSGSASYLTNMLVSLMPESGGDNAMWQGRAIALVSALMPCLVYKRDKQNIPLSIAVIRQYLTFKAIIKLSRDSSIPDSLRAAVKAYLAELPGYVDNVFDDNGDEKPAGPDVAAVDTSVPRQQHGYLSMQFTRSMQSLGDDYGFIFDTQAADIDIMDVVLQRRILVVLIPALEKSDDETANLGKIISSTLKGMMGATLGSTVEGESATVIENKPTNSPTPFIAIFDEVGYYTAQGMAVMAAQARSLGFSLVFAGQDLPAMEKRVKEEARSITANCNIKLFGKLEDPTQTKDFFEKTVGSATVAQVSGYQRSGGSNYTDSQNASLQSQAKASYDGLKGFNEGRAVCAFGKNVHEIQVYYPDIGDAKAMRVQRFLGIPPPADEALESLRQVDAILRRLRNPDWNPEAVHIAPNADIAALAKGFADGRKAKEGFVESGIMAVAGVAEVHGTITPADADKQDAPGAGGDAGPKAPSPEAEKASAAAIAKVTPGGPLNWAEVIGSAEAAGPSVPIGTSGATASLRRDPPVADVPADAATSPPSAAALKESPLPSGKTVGAPLSWMDVIGAAPSSLQITAPPAETAPAAPAAPFLPVAEEPKKPAAAAAPAAPAQDDGVKIPISWADVIGAATDDKKEDGA